MNAPVELHSRQSEQAVLGALLLDPSSLDKIVDKLDARAFYDAAHQTIYRTICTMSQRGQAVDLLTVSAALEAAGEGEWTGGFAYLGELAANVPGASSIRRYAGIVTEKAQLRHMLAISNHGAALATETTGRSVAERIDEFESMVMGLAESEAAGEQQPKLVSQVLGPVIDDIQARADAETPICGTPTGFTDLDEKLCGLQDGDLIIVAGRPSMGKTAFALNIGEHVAVELGKPVAVFSMEMGDKQLVQRALSSIGGIQSQSLRNGRMTDDEWSRLNYALGRLHEAKLIIDESPALNAMQIRARARRIKRQHGLSLIIIDYLQLMSAPSTGRGDNRNEEISTITRSLKALAKELSVPVIALSQLSRKVEERADKRPMMSDLRESGAIEQDADVIVFLYRDEYYRPDSQDKGLAEAIIAKQRMGPTGMVRLVFQGEFSRFRNLAPGQYAQIMANQAVAKPMRRSRVQEGEM